MRAAVPCMFLSRVAYKRYPVRAVSFSSLPSFWFFQVQVLSSSCACTCSRVVEFAPSPSPRLEFVPSHIASPRIRAASFSSPRVRAFPFSSRQAGTIWGCAYQLSLSLSLSHTNTHSQNTACALRVVFVFCEAIAGLLGQSEGMRMQYKIRACV
jgi:hypothetical protein